KASAARRLPIAGLPIAAHLALMLALAFLAAFVVIVAVIIWLPPRPPTLVPGGEIVWRFPHGYEGARTNGATPPHATGEWRITSDPPRTMASMSNHMLQMQLAERLSLTPRDVRISAKTERSDFFMYRVRDMGHGAVQIHGMAVGDGANVTINGANGETIVVPR